MKSGFILVNKNDDKTSNNLDNYIKKNLQFKRVGHLGTLDPLAKGLMILMVDDATKYAKYFDNLDKTYIIEVMLGKTTRSLDLEGEVISEMDFDYTSKEDELDNILNSFKGKYQQTPPIYSSIKVNGKKYYELANKNIDFEPKKRDVEVFDIKRLSDISYHDNVSTFTLIVHVSKGYYVRSLAKEIGDKLNVPSLCSSILRVKSGEFSLGDAYTKEEILEGNYKFVNPLDYLDFNEYIIDKSLETLVLNGAKIKLPPNYKHEYYIIRNAQKEDIAIYKRDENIYKMDLLIKR
ncbi:MAG: tRNA pseudouridine(55) synthase TruB [Gammaproteobacteria bacterium]|nr:tRNA pseudouridine(55) synthase TruB [Gammaproteobacteria bacterium]